MLADIRLTPDQLRAVAAWAAVGPDMADVHLRVDGYTVAAKQGDESAVFDTAGNVLNDA